MPIKKQQPIVCSIFGASGDLAKLKLFPAMYELAYKKRLPPKFYICGFSRTDVSRAEFQKEFKAAIKKHSKLPYDKKIVDALVRRIHYFAGQYDELVDYEKYIARIETTLRTKTFTHIVYFAVPPIAFKDIVRNISMSRRSVSDDIRLVIEKPFGEDKESAEALFHFVSQYFEEEQFYLLDHYLGKSSVRSILHLRYSNRILSEIMRGSQIANIQITASENYGVENRVGYFDEVGMVRDMMQSHLLQVMALTTMSIPVNKDAKSLQREKHNILSAIDCPCDSDNIVLGQYTGYKKTNGVRKGSKTETFAAMRLFIDREDWYDVPIYIRTGKNLHEKHTYVVIELKKFPFQEDDEEPNRIVFELQPYERVHILLINKHEDIKQYQEIRTTDSIACEADGCLAEHGVLLLDVIQEDKVHFLSFNEIIAAWDVIDVVQDMIKKQKVRIQSYKKGSMGPKSQDALPAHDGFSWYDVHEKT